MKVLEKDGLDYLTTKLDEKIKAAQESSDKLTTARKISLSGVVSGNVLFDGSEDVVIDTTIDVIDGGTF